MFGSKKHAPWKKSGTIASTLIRPVRQMTLSSTLDATSWRVHHPSESNKLPILIRIAPDKMFRTLCVYDAGQNTWLVFLEITQIGCFVRPLKKHSRDISSK